MNGEVTGYPGPRDEAERLNEESAKVVQELLYAKTVDAIYDGIAMHLAYDKDAQENQTDTPGFIGAFVQHDVLTAPMNHEGAVATYCTRLEPDVPDDDGMKYLELHIPINDEEISDFEMPAVSDVREVYIKVGYAKRNYWYAFNKNLGLYEYVLTNNNDSGDDVMHLEGMWQDKDKLVSDNSELAIQLLKRIINWRTVPQDASGVIVYDVPDLEEP